MSKYCKCAKWFPHNWLCLRGLSVIFLILFYIAFLWGIWVAILVFMHPSFTGLYMWKVAVSYLVHPFWDAALGFLTVAKILKALYKIEHAVAPCCCHGKTEEKKCETAK